MTLEQITQSDVFDEVRPGTGQTFMRLTIPVIINDEETMVAVSITSPSIKGNIILEESSISVNSVLTNKEIKIPPALNPKIGLRKTLEALVNPVFDNLPAKPEGVSDSSVELINSIKENLNSAAKIIGDTMVIYAEGLPRNVTDGIYLYLHQRIIHHTHNARRRLSQPAEHTEGH